mgnify:CR=1 FL=1
MTPHSKSFSLFLNRYLYASPRLTLNLFNHLTCLDDFIEKYDLIEKTYNLSTHDLLNKAKEFDYEKELKILEKK